MRQLQESRFACRVSVADVRQKRHEASPFNGQRNRVLAGGGAAAFAAAYDLALPVGQLAEQVEVFVVHVHGTWTLTVDKDRVFFLAANFGFIGPASRCRL